MKTRKIHTWVGEILAVSLLVCASIQVRADLVVDKTLGSQNVSVSDADSDAVFLGAGLHQTQSSPVDVNFSGEETAYSPSTGDSAYALVNFTANYSIGSEGLDLSGASSLSASSKYSTGGGNIGFEADVITGITFTPDENLAYTADLSAFEYFQLLDFTNPASSVVFKPGHYSGTLTAGDTYYLGVGSGEDDSGFASYSLPSQSFVYSFSAGSVPEPSTYAMLLSGLSLMGVCLRRRLILGDNGRDQILTAPPALA